MALDGICPECTGQQRKNGFSQSSGGGRYQRMYCKACHKVEYVPLEDRRTLTWKEVEQLYKDGRLRVWLDGKALGVGE